MNISNFDYFIQLINDKGEVHREFTIKQEDLEKQKSRIINYGWTGMQKVKIFKRTLSEEIVL